MPITQGELTNFKQLPVAISSGKEHLILGRLIAVSRYHDRYYPIVYRKGKIQVMTQGATNLSHVVRHLDDGHKVTKPFVILSYDTNGRFVPQSYVQT
jgi:hypothetical protein